MGVLQEAQVGIDVRDSAAQVVLDGVQLDSQPFALLLDVSQAGANLGLWKAAVGSQVEQILFLGVESNELIIELLSEQSLSALAVSEGALHCRPDCGDELGAELDRLVVLFDGDFNAVHVGVWGVTVVILGADAEEIPVLVALLADRALDDHASDLFVLEPAASAEQGAFEVVLMHPSPFASSASGVHDLLDLVEEFLADDRGVTSVVVLTLEVYLAEVVPVAKQVVHLLN